jgi:hypothetical protein
VPCASSKHIAATSHISISGPATPGGEEATHDPGPNPDPPCGNHCHLAALRADNTSVLRARQTFDGLEDGAPVKNATGDLYRAAEFVISSVGLHQRAHGRIVIEHG